MTPTSIPGTDLTVHPICLGLGDFGTRVAGEAALRLFDSFVAAGGNFVDTAHCYSFWVPDGLGASERQLGECLRRLGCRGQMVIATKGGHPDGGKGYPRSDQYLAPEVVARH